MFIEIEISSYNPELFWEQRKNIIPGLTTELTPEQKTTCTQDIYPIIKISIKLLDEIENRIDAKIFKQLAYDITCSNIRHLEEINKQYLEKFDSFLFMIKNLLLLNKNLQKIKMDICITE